MKQQKFQPTVSHHQQVAPQQQRVYLPTPVPQSFPYVIPSQRSEPLHQGKDKKNVEEFSQTLKCEKSRNFGFWKNDPRAITPKCI